MRTPDNLKSLHEEMDRLAMRLVEVMQELINAKLKLEQTTKEGFLLLSKSRYSMGANAVSALQLPSPESDEAFEAKMKTSGEDCLRTDISVRFKYLSLVDKNPPAQESIRSRRKGASEDEEKKAVAADKEQANQNPLRWFGVLVPQSLKQTQKSFERATQLAVEVANIQAELGGIMGRQKFLERTKLKMIKEAEPVS